MTGTQFCHMCGHRLEAGDKFCPQCGARTGEEFCRMCGHQLEARDKFCPQCGARVLLIEKIPKPEVVDIHRVRPAEVKPEEIEPTYDYVDLEGEIAALPGERLLFPPKSIKTKFHKGNIRKWILDPLGGILIWVVSAALIFLVFDDGWEFFQYRTGKFADWLEYGPQGLFDHPSVVWFVGIGIFMFVLGWLWSLISLVRGPPKVDLFATNKRLIFRDNERTGFLTRAMLGVNIFLILRNPFHIKKVSRTYRDLRHQWEAARDEREYEYLILKQEECITNVKMKNVTYFFEAFIFLVVMFLYPLLSPIFFILFLLFLVISFYGLLLRGTRPRIAFQKNKCQGKLRFFVESTELDVIGLMDEEEKIIMQTYGH